MPFFPTDHGRGRGGVIRHLVTLIRGDAMTSQETTPAAATLVAIVVAARRAGDRELERQARRELHERHSVKLSFVRESRRKEGDDAQ